MRLRLESHRRRMTGVMGRETGQIAHSRRLFIFPWFVIEVSWWRYPGRPAKRVPRPANLKSGLGR